MQVKNKEKSGTQNKWLEAASRAEKHIDGLKTAIRVFKRNAENGEPWPGQEKAGMEKDSIPA